MARAMYGMSPRFGGIAGRPGGANSRPALTTSRSDHSMPTASCVLTQKPDLAEVPALLRRLSALLRQAADLQAGRELHRVSAGGTPHVLNPAAVLAEVASTLADLAGDLGGTLSVAGLDADDIQAAA